ncbi:uncharacterized protein EI90DRAFT_3048392 [Cantharellus anzutake]|uniref:uncharacterized protein n=1 Tax=Cantharellus anzutake TaxID=1750568 RepID=UPI0019078AF6|nr:uncharacterized protein EI90DRAFT_3048392 [Cantharellus anzutake]KAF8335445.1 hypothetical protein EI90DRAFT_3048392 [Cantharellus anzutake]
MLRFDWRNYLSLEASIGRRSLMDMIRWTNIEDYEHGISRHWLRRMAKRELPGTYTLNEALLKVARRYILANVAGNSLSGSFQTSIEMACESNGQHCNIPSALSAITIPSLFVPEHHYVESVHLMNSRGIPLHPAIAVVQTPAREYYILRDTGQEIGCEEAGGVYKCWLDVIRCQEDGVST